MKTEEAMNSENKSIKQRDFCPLSRRCRRNAKSSLRYLVWYNSCQGTVSKIVLAKSEMGARYKAARNFKCRQDILRVYKYGEGEVCLRGVDIQ